MNDGTKYEWGAAGGDSKVWFFVLEEFPGCFFSKGFGGAVAGGGVLDGFFFGDGVPIFFAVDVARAGALGAVDY